MLLGCKNIGFEVRNHSFWTVKPQVLKGKSIGFVQRNVRRGNESLRFRVFNVCFFQNQFLF